MQGNNTAETGLRLELVQTATFTAAIHCGLKERNTGLIHSLDDARWVCQEFVDRVGLCLSFTPTEYIYTNGSEPGVIVGLINYPRFPSGEDEIRKKALDLAEALMLAFNQYAMSVVCQDVTVMLVNPALKTQNSPEAYD